MTRTEWLEQVAVDHAINDLRRGVGFMISAPEQGARTMTQFSADYRNGNRPGTTPKSALRHEIGSRAFFAMEDESGEDIR